MSGMSGLSENRGRTVCYTFKSPNGTTIYVQPARNFGMTALSKALRAKSLTAEDFGREWDAIHEERRQRVEAEEEKPEPPRRIDMVQPIIFTRESSEDQVMFVESLECD